MKSIREPTSERGQSLVEMAITLTLLLILLAGIVDVGSAFFIMVQLNDAAAEGAVYGSLHPTDTGGIAGRALTSASDPLDLGDPINNVSVAVSAPSAHASPCEGDRITVVVSYDYHIQMPFITTFIGTDTITLSGRSTDTILQPGCP